MFGNVSESFDLTSINLLDNSTTQALLDVKNSAALNINFTAIDDIVSKNSALYISYVLVLVSAVSVSVD